VGMVERRMSAFVCAAYAQIRSTEGVEADSSAWRVCVRRSMAGRLRGPESLLSERRRAPPPGALIDRSPEDPHPRGKSKINSTQPERRWPCSQAILPGNKIHEYKGYQPLSPVIPSRVLSGTNTTTSFGSGEMGRPGYGRGHLSGLAAAPHGGYDHCRLWGLRLHKSL
jgi:hypothetical protein